MTSPRPVASSRAILIICAMMHMVLSTSTDIYLAAMPNVVRDLSASIESVQYTMVMFMAGLIVSHLLIGGFADHYGRKPVLIAGLIGYIAASLACVLAVNLWGLIAARTAQGFFAACGPIMMRAVIRDIVPAAENPRAFATVGTVASLGPVFAPIVGGLLADWGGWRFSLAALVVFGCLLLALVIVVLPETLTVEKRSATARGNPFGTLRVLLASASFRTGAALVFCWYGALFSWLSLSAHLLARDYHFSLTEMALSYGLWSGSFLLGNVACARLLRKHGPEKLVMGAALAAMSALLLFTLLRANLPFALPKLAVFLLLAPFFISWGFGLPLAMGLAMRPFGAIAGQASAWFGIAQYGGGILISLLAGFLGAAGLGVPLAMSFAMALAALIAWRARRRVMAEERV